MWTKIYISFIVLSLTLVSYTLVGQSEMDKKLAQTYYSEADYEKAITYFEKVYKVDQSEEVFKPYYQSLMATENFKEAHKLVKKQSKIYPHLLNLIVLDGLIYESEQDADKATKCYDEAIESLNKLSDYQEIIGLANAFEQNNKIDLAIRTFQEANQYAATSNMYLRNIAMLYGRQGKTELMVETFLDILHDDDRYYVSVQSSLSNSVDFENDPKGVNILKSSLIKRSQDNPNKTVYNELLAWVYMLTENYAGAFIQLKALDKKEKNDGRRIKELGITCINNEHYDDAIRCFDYVLELGPNKLHYREAKIYKVSALQKKILEKGTYTQDELLSLKSSYLESLDNLGKSVYTESLIRDLAKLEGYYLNNPKEGINLLEELLNIPGLKKRNIGEIKIELGDLMVIDDRIWDASLLFMQVEKEFKEDKVGHLAKFKAAQVFYFAGDFDFAQGQLDVLKASTSKLIANDAMELSMLITDNYNMDTTQVTMRLFAAAELLIKQHQYNKAHETFDSITSMFTYHTLNDEILFKKSEMALAQQNTDAAIEYLNEIVKNYGSDILADNALFALAQIYDIQLNNQEKAAEYYKKIIFEYKGSLFGVQARKRYREIKPSAANDAPTIITP